MAFPSWYLKTNAWRLPVFRRMTIGDPILRAHGECGCLASLCACARPGEED